jgi:hypothetical protein
MRCVASILPKEIDATLSVDVELFAEAKTLAEAYKMARDYIGADERSLIELDSEPEDE